jgi:D-Tyr-tRNAtyr deacylase
MDHTKGQVRHSIEAVLGIGDEDKEDHLQNTEDLHLELVVLEDEHAFLYFPWLED